ncbi:MAG TPA: 4-hydroxythreonine-4-phosphate dehydrogenase PdxA [Phaeodactylibacter sp.]|nr:4-hydroxythreonine-4-phosphate dehydrogenase PdxA [Phaeodactylibacter sp.]
MEKKKIGISIGDVNGVGLEVILKTLANPQIVEMCTPIIYGSSKVVSYHKNVLGLNINFQSIESAQRNYKGRINVVNCWHEDVKITLGNPSENGGKYAFKSLAAATQELKEGFIDALVTAPIHKKGMQETGFQFPGHTEYLTKEFEASESLMLMVNDTLRVGVVTNHLPLKEVAAAVTKEKIIRKLKILNKTLKKDFGIERPKIALLGLNPHAGDSGMLGSEEENIIRPAIIESKKKGYIANGPFPADGFFGSGQYRKFDAILAMYHDQGLIPFKALSFGAGVNFTAGLSGVRTSPDHGTAFDIAGTNIASPDSFRQALFLAIDIATQRKKFEKMHENPVVSRSKKFTQGKDEVLR